MQKFIIAMFKASHWSSLPNLFANYSHSDICMNWDMFIFPHYVLSSSLLMFLFIIYFIPLEVCFFEHFCIFSLF